MTCPMNPLPSAVEHSLIEAGCSSTEILLIQHMLNGDPTTLRILAQKTGKSTGVLDQAMKKLMKKGIVVRETVNDNPKFVLKSLQNVVQWLHDETLHRREMLLRKYQTFEAFVTTMESEKNRPEMKYFDGDDGLEQAYFSLIEQGKHWRQYIPVNGREQDDPLWQMRVRLFRARKEAGVFCRVITHDTEDGCAFQARDQYEYRETMLVSKESCPIPCEKIIVGNVVACFQHAQKRACFVRFPEQVESEAGAFDLLWKILSDEKLLAAKDQRNTFAASAKTTAFSNLRLFLLSKFNIAFFVFAIITSLLLSAAAYASHVENTKHKIREKIRSAVGVGALLFDYKDIEEIQDTSDMNKSEYLKIIQILRGFRENSNADIKYAYLLRPAKDFGYEYIAEADAIDPTVAIDFDNDGILSAADEYVLPGRKYVSQVGDAIFETMPKEPIANDEAILDQWGSFYSAYAPIFNDKGDIIALLAVDVWSKTVAQTMNASFVGGVSFLVVFTTMIIVYLLSFSLKRLLIDRLS